MISKKNSLLLLIVSYLSVSCGLFSSVGGMWKQNQVQLNIAEENITSSMVLVLGQYNDELAGHILLDDFTTCPCSYVVGSYDEGSKTVTLEFDTKISTKCPKLFLQLNYSKTDSEEILKGMIYADSTLSTPLSNEEIKLKRTKEQKELVITDKQGCY